MDLIERHVALNAVDAIGHIATMPDGDKCIRRSAVKYTLSMLPSAQPEIIRCKDCKYKGTKNCVANAWTTIFGFGVKDDFYCGLAERRTDETD